MANASPIEEDYEHSPLSTEDEQEECEVRITGIYEKTPSKDSSQKNRASALNKGIISNAKPPRQGTRSQPKRGPSRFKDEIPSRTEGVLVGSKRKSTDTAEIDATDDDEAFLDEWKRSQSQSEKRPKYTYAKSKRPFAEPENIHGNETPRKRRSRASAVPTLESPPKSQGSAQKFRSPRQKLAALDEEHSRNKSNRSFKVPPMQGKEDDLLDSSAADSAISMSLSTQDKDINAFSDTSSDLSSCPPDAELEEEGLAFASTKDGEDRRLAHCPICRETIDRDHLDLFTNGKRLNWRDKLAFCESHKRRDAEKDWNQRRYPEIDWSGFERRLEAYYAHILGVLDQTKESFFRQELSSKVDSGWVRQAFRDVKGSKEENTTPGYYGPKGATLMQSHIVGAFGSRLRDMVENDAVMRAAGISNYIQSVLVPELAIMLIKDDMKLGCEDDEKARAIMKESAEAGDLMNPQDEDNVKRETDEDFGVFTQAE